MINSFLNHLNSKSLHDVLIKTRNLTKGSLDKKIYFHHIPKCGGTSLNRALQACYVKWNLWDSSNVFNLNSAASWETAQIILDEKLPSDTVNDSAVMRLREELLIYFMSLERIYYISGHFPFSSLAYQQYSERFEFITILRDPLERWISSYFYNNYRQKSSYRKISFELEEYIKSDFGKSQGYEYTKFLGGTTEDGNFMTSESVQRAKENLHKFHLIGFLDDMSAFKEQFYQKYNTKLLINALNKRPDTEKKLNESITEDMMKSIEEICQPDIEIYEYAVDKFRN